MTQEDKSLLLQDLSARLPYGVMVDVNFYDATKELSCDLLKDFIIDEKSVRPYLRPMSSMTKEERMEYFLLKHRDNDREDNIILIDEAFSLIDWLLSHHFDYRRLIEKGLALEAQEGMYN
jgi:hypothetical protein